MKINKKAFTLVELIVVITILAILGTIAFLSLQGYRSSARNSTRVSDLSSLKSGLELYSLKVGGYPDPTNGVGITYSGGVAWVQGTMGDSTIKQLSSLNKTPSDPSVGNEYTYSLLNTRLEYQLGSIEEIGFGKNENSQSVILANELIPSSYASEKNALAVILGNYNGQILKVSTGSTDYILAVPSIIVTDAQIKDIPTILNNRLLSYNKYGNLPGSYNGKGYTMTGGFNYGGASLNPLLYTGNTTILINSGTLQIVFVDNLKNAYLGSQLIGDGNIQQLLSTTNATEKQNLVASMVNSKVSGLVGQIAIQSVPTNGCTTQPSYTGAIFTVGTPTTSNESWQSTSTGSACYFTCGLGKVLVGNNCVSETCVGTTPDGISSTANATSTAGGTWNYNVTGGLCTFVCNSGYTWNGSSCVILRGEQQYTTPGSYTWVVPSGVTSVSVVCVGAGGSSQGGGGELRYKNNITVNSGAGINIIVGGAIANSDGGTSSFLNLCVANGGKHIQSAYTTSPGGFGGIGDGGGNGGDSGYLVPTYCAGGGGGAGGYTGNGGTGGYGAGGPDSNGGVGGSGQGGGGGGGGGGSAFTNNGCWGAGGGGVGLLGIGTNGAGGTAAAANGGGFVGPGGGGSNGVSGVSGTDAYGGQYGGGGGMQGGGTPNPTNVLGGNGACRIIWPGNTRQFPSTDVGL